MSEEQNEHTPIEVKPKRSSLKGGNMMDPNEIMKYSKKKRNSVSFQLGANFQFNKLRTTFQEMKPQIVNPTKKKSFVEKRKQSIKNEFALAKELLKKRKSIDEIENETEEVIENTNKNLQVGKEIKESESEDDSDDSSEDEKNAKKNEEIKNEEIKKEEIKKEEIKKEDEKKDEEIKKEDEKNKKKNEEIKIEDENNDDNFEAPDSNRGEKEALNEKKQLNTNCKFC